MPLKMNHQNPQKLDTEFHRENTEFHGVFR
jgi:hypothetical protein